MIIGLTSALCAGKGEVVEYLKTLGFKLHSLSDIIRDEADKQGIEKNRENMIILGNRLREQYGNDVLAKRIKKKLEGDNIVIDSIRNTAEVRELKKMPDFILVGIEALEEIRFTRMLQRRRPGDPKTLAEFRAVTENQDIENGQQVQKCMKIAECIIKNEGTKEQLHNKIDRMLKDLHVKTFSRTRLSKDEYYLKIAQAVSKRATCLRRGYGAIIVKDDHIISTGYCGAPRGAENCSDKGSCLREELNIASGERYELCYSVHAEANCIINAARAGVSVLSGKLYLAGFDAKTGEIIPAKPCKMCKRMIINAGIKTVIVKNVDGFKLYDVKSWLTDTEGDNT